MSLSNIGRCVQNYQAWWGGDRRDGCSRSPVSFTARQLKKQVDAPIVYLWGCRCICGECGPGFSDEGDMEEYL